MKISHAWIAAAVSASLAGCQSGTRESPPPPTDKSASLRVMEQVAIAAYRCWFESKDPFFRSYRMANELNSFSGQPRFLVVPAKDYGGKPLLVVQARGNSSEVEIFGPMMAGPMSERISSDVGRWKRGDGTCGPAV